MAFDYQKEGTQHHPLVAPEIPNVKPMPAGDMLGGSLLQAFVHRAIASEQASLEQQRTMQSADIEARRLELAKKTEADNFEVAKYNAESLAKYRREYGPIIGGRAAAAADAKIQAAKAYGDYQDTVTENDGRFDNAVVDLNLADAKFQNNDPVGWLQNFSELKNRFGTAVVGKPTRGIKQLQSQADLLKVPFVHGAELVESAPDAKDWHWIGANNNKTVDVPIEQIVRQWQNPQLREGITRGLVAAGHGKIVDQLDPEGRAWGGFRKVQNTKKVPTLDEYGNALLLKAGKVDLGRGKNEVPDVLTRPSNTRVERYGGADGGGDAGGGASDGTLPDTSDSGVGSEEPDVLPANNEIDQGPRQGSNTPKFTPTKTDMVLQHARNALAANPGARQQIIERLQGMGISPDYLNA